MTQSSLGREPAVGAGCQSTPATAPRIAGLAATRAPFHTSKSFFMLASMPCM